MAKIHPDHTASKTLRSLLPHDTFIMSPLLEGKWIKISGSDGSVKTDWRDDEIQHFVMHSSSERLIITDLQGKFKF